MTCLSSCTSTFPSFSCLGEINSNDPALEDTGYVKQKVIYHIIRPMDEDESSKLGGFLQRDCTFFGYTFDYFSAWEQDIETLLNFAGLSLALLHQQGTSVSSCMPRSHHTDVSNFIKLRSDLTAFLSYINGYACRALATQLCSSELLHFHKQVELIVASLQPFVASIEFIPVHILAAPASPQGNNCPSGSYHYFHAYLDVRWSLIQLLNTCCHQIGKSSPTEMASTLNTLEEQMLEDLVYLALIRFGKISNTDWAGTSPFSCTCVREFWLMLEIMLDTRTDHQTGSSFWSLMKDILRKRILEPSGENIPRWKCQFPVAFALWLGVHLGKLDCYTIEGDFGLPTERMDANLSFYYPFVKAYLQSNPTENELRILIALILVSFQTWKPHLNLLLECLEFFLKRLNSNFALSGSNTIDTYVELMRSGSSWLDKLGQSFDVAKNSSGNVSSYSLFLRLLGLSVQSFRQENQLSDWRSLRGRLWLKCNAKRTTELSEIGLYHLFSMLLTLTLVADLNEVASKVTELVGFLPPIPSQKHWIGWSAHLALLISHARRKQPMNQPILDINEKFQLMTRELQLQDQEKRQFLIKATRLYMEALQDVFDASTALDLGQHLLLSPALSAYVGTCGSADQKFTLNLLKSIVEKILLLVHSDEERTVFMEVLSKYVVPITKQLAWVSQTSTAVSVGPLRLAPASVTSLAALGVQLTLLWQKWNDLERCRDLFTYCAYGEHLNVSVCAHYLSLLLDKHNFLPTLALFVDQYQSFIIRAWFRLALLIVPLDEAYPDLQSIQKLMIRLPEVAELFLKAQVNPRELNLETFIATLCTAMKSAKTSTEQSIARDKFTKYLGPIDKYLSGILKKWQPASSVIHVYKALAYLFRYGAPWLYVRGKADCMFCVLTSQLLLPAISFDSSKTFPPALNFALESYLKDFLTGFASLNLTDPYVRRCLKDLVLNYSPKFAYNEKHPLIVFYLESRTVEGQAITPVQKLFLDILNENCLVKKGGQFPPLLNQALTFLTSLAIAGKGLRVFIQLREVLGVGLLEILLVLEDFGTKRVATELVRQIFQTDSESSMSAMPHLETLILRHLAFNAARLFKLLETLTVMVPDLVRASLPCLEGEVLRTEAKRGTGTDQTLRQGLQKLKISLGAPT